MSRYAPAPSKPQEEMLARSLADYRSQAARLAKEVEAVSTKLHADQREHTEVANYLSAEVQALTERTRAMQVRRFAICPESNVMRESMLRQSV
jgi:hypothetical protein